MTKADARLIGYVPCTDVISTKIACQENGILLHPEHQGSKCAMNGGPKNGYIPSVTSASAYPSACMNGGTHIPNGTAHCEKEEEEQDNEQKATEGDSASCDACQKCSEMNRSDTFDETTSEKSLLQGKCNRHHHELAKDNVRNSLSVYKEQKHPPNGLSRSPLSNYSKDRKRTPSGGSVIKQIQIAIEKEEEEVKEACKSCDCQWKLHFAMITLLFANLINYMDRYTIAGVLLQIQDFYGISNGGAGLLQTSFIVFYMLFSPLFGFLGDRWNRKYLMAGGIFFWSIITLAGSFIPEDKFWLFLLMRAMVGVGEASYSTIAPTIIADLFVKDNRSKALSVFYFAIPVGSGLGYIVGAKVAIALGGWQWALRVTPGLGLVCVFMILLCVDEPSRGHAEGGEHLHSTSWTADMKYLVKNRSFILSTGGFTCVSFVAGALALWAPAYIDYSIRIGGTAMEESQVALYFGIITCAAGFIGVGLGSETARRMRKTNPRADPLVCAFGLLVSAPFLFLVIFMSKYSAPATWVLIFIGEVFLCLNWAIVTDILLYIIIPTRRSSAEAVQILFSHAFGDAGSPYILGAISDYLRTSDDSTMQMYISLHYALYITCFVAVLGGGFFLATAMFVEEDRKKADKVITGALAMQSKTSQKDIVTISSAHKPDLDVITTETEQV